MDLISFLTSWQFVLLFYILVIAIIYIFRKKFDFQAKFIAMYRTKVGLKAMKWISENFRKPVQWLGYIGIVVGYLGMLVIVFFIFQGLFNLLFRPELPATVAPVIPGVKIPGSPVFVPFWYGMISLFLVIVIHEFSHGVVSKAHKIPVKSSGFVLFGPIPGAFVEPDEKKLMKKSYAVQNSVFAAGPFSNVLTAIVIIGLFFLILNPLVANNFDNNGFGFSKIEPGYPAEIAGLTTTEVYTEINGVEALNALEFVEQLGNPKPGDKILIGNANAMYEVVAVEHPVKEGEGYIGVNIVTRFSNDQSSAFKFLQIIIQLLNWLFLLSLGLGLANLLPLGPVDGGRMFQIFCWKAFGKKKGNVVWAKTGIAFFVLILILLFVPILKAVLI